MRCFIFLLLCFSSSQIIAEEIKIAVVDEQKLMSDYERSQALVQRLREKYMKEEKRLQELNKKIQGSEENLERQLKMAGPEQKQKLFEELTRAKMELEISEKSMRESHLFEKNQYTMMVIEDINEALATIGRDSGYDLILRKYVPSGSNGEPQSNVLFYSEKLDVTQEVLKFLNSKYRQSQE